MPDTRAQDLRSQAHQIFNKFNKSNKFNKFNKFNKWAWGGYDTIY